MTSYTLAWSNLSQQVARTLISLIGIAFAVLLVFMQLGFFDAVKRTATLLFDKLDFDLMLVSREYISLVNPASFPRSRLAQVRAVTGVQEVHSLTLMLGLWRDPRLLSPDPDRARFNWSIMVVALAPESVGQLFRQPIGTVFRSEEELIRDSIQLARLDTVLMDRSSRKEYGDPVLWRRQPRNELNGRQVEIIGNVEIGTGFGYNGLLLTSEATLSRITGWPDHRVSFGLIKLTEGMDPGQAAASMRMILPEEVQVYTRQEINQKEQRFWLNSTAVGQFFFVGVIIALLVGGVFVYQMMSADISRRLTEYATIRALGYPRGYLSSVVYWQGLLLAMIGYLPGLLVSLLGYALARSEASIPITMTVLRAIVVLILTILMCMGSALIAVRSAHRANPADLF